MSRVTKRPVPVPSGVDINLAGQTLSVKGPKGQLDMEVHEDVEVIQEDGMLRFAPRRERRAAVALTGTMRALANNMVQGVTDGYEIRLQLMGVGYRAQLQGQNLHLVLGYSHPVNYEIPQGVTIETPTQTEVVVKGIDKQIVGQVAAVIRGFRPPEPYKGKGIRYADERISLKEAKKK